MARSTRQPDVLTSNLCGSLLQTRVPSPDLRRSNNSPCHSGTHPRGDRRAARAPQGDRSTHPSSRVPVAHHELHAYTAIPIVE